MREYGGEINFIHLGEAETG